MSSRQKLGLIAGNGKFPFLIVDAARAQGLDVVVAAIKEETFPEIETCGAAGVEALYSAARNLDRAIDFIEQAADACWSDIEKLCADVPEGWRSHRTMHAYQKIDRKPRLSEDIGSVAGSEIAGNWHEHLRKLGI